MQINSQLNAVINEINEDYSLYYTQAIDEAYAIIKSNEITTHQAQLRAVRIA